MNGSPQKNLTRKGQKTMKLHFFTSLLFCLQAAFASETTIALGSTNPVKYEALQNVIDDLSERDNIFSHATIETCSVSSDVRKQPVSIRETMNGAIHRARNAYKLLKESGAPCDLAVGIESGIMELPIKNLNFNRFDVTVCAVYDGKDHWFGLSCSFQLPSCVTDLIDNETDLDLGQAMRLSGLTHKFEVGKEEGSIGVFTKGKVSRKDYTEQAIRMALIPLQNKEAYQVAYAN